MFGYCATGRPAMETRPTITMMMAITIATIGRRMKKFDMACYFVVSGAGEVEGLADPVAEAVGIW